MKGFIYLLEVAVAGILVALILGSFLTLQTTKTQWGKSDLIELGKNIFYALDNSGDIMRLLNDSDNTFNKINKLKPPNVDYGIFVSGTPNNNIKVACQLNCAYVNSLLTDVFVNGRKIKFSVTQVDILTDNLDKYDTIILVDQTNYGEPYKSKLLNLMSSGKTIVAVNDTISTTNTDFNFIFGLTTTGTFTKDFLRLKKYNLDYSDDSISRYFLGFGFDIQTPDDYANDPGKSWGYWYIWEDKKVVNITRVGGNFFVEIQDVSGRKKEGDTFTRIGPDGNTYTFKVKKIFNLKSAEFQPLDKNFVFRDFSEDNVVHYKLNNLLFRVASPSNVAGATRNGTAIWISNFPWSDEYRTLVKAAVASGAERWFLKEQVQKNNTISVPFFVDLCCDMPENPEVDFIFWYLY